MSAKDEPRKNPGAKNANRRIDLMTGNSCLLRDFGNQVHFVHFVFRVSIRLFYYSIFRSKNGWNEGFLLVRAVKFTAERER